MTIKIAASGSCFWKLLLAACLTACSSMRHDQQPLNVVIFLVDDLGHADLGFSGSNFYQTPNIDSLAAGAFIFRQGYAGSRVCSPSRATIMTGKFTTGHGITDWIGAKTGEDWRTHQRHNKLLPADYHHQLEAKELTIAEALKREGYTTFYAGKWHLGTEGSYPEDHGFDINKGGWEKGSPIGGYFSPWENPKLENLENGENLSIRLAKETSRFIREHGENKFLAVLSFYAVHSPIQTTRQKWSKYRQLAESRGIAPEGYQMERILPIRVVQDNPVYGGLVETVDDAVGVVLDQLRKSGLEKNTVIVFTSDNGGVASGDNFSTSNRPLRGGKGYQWEGGIRVPFFVKAPGYSPGQSSAPVCGADIFPTIIDLLGLDTGVDHLDGRSLRAILSGKDGLPDRPLYWHYPHYGNQGGEPSSIIRVGEWKLIKYWEDGRQELYNLRLDPGEKSDLGMQYPKIVDSLGQKLSHWLTSCGARLPVPDPEYDESQAEKRKISLRSELWPELESRRLEMLSPSFQPNKDWWGSEPD